MMMQRIRHIIVWLSHLSHKYTTAQDDMAVYDRELYKALSYFVATEAE
jgi:hypothetical protein